MVQKLVSTAVEESEDFFYLPKLYVGPDPKPTEPTERIYVVGDMAVTGDLTVANVFVPDGGTFGIAGNELLTFNAAGTAVFSGCMVGIGGTPDEALTIMGVASTRRDLHLVAYSDGVPDHIQPRLIFSRSHSDTPGTKIDTIDGDELANILFKGVDNTQKFDVGAKITAIQDGAVGARVPTNLIFETWSATAENDNQLVLHHDGGVGVGLLLPAGKVHIDQASSTGAIPVLVLDQADVSEEMIEFITTIGVGNPIEAVNGKTLTTTHFVKVTIPGPLTRYIPVGTIA